MNMSKIFSAAVVVALMAFIQSPRAYSHESKMNAADTDLARKVRQDLAADSSLSAYAQNIKIVALNGKVSLTGKVNSDVERQNIINKVTGEAGVSNVDSKLEVAGTASGTTDQE